MPTGSSLAFFGIPENDFDMFSCKCSLKILERKVQEAYDKFLQYHVFRV